MRVVNQMRPKLALIAMIMVLVVSGCGTSADSSDNRREESEEALYKAVSLQLDDFQWGPRHVPDMDKLFDRIYGGTIIQSPDRYAEMVLGIFEQCSWAMEWLDAWEEGDTASQERSQNKMEEVFAGSVDVPAGQAHLMQIVEMAALGDPTGVQQFIKANCLPPDWLVDS